MGFQAVILFLIAMGVTSVMRVMDNRPLPSRVEWNNSSSLPSLHDKEENRGVAGAFSGFVGNELIIVGGANFSDKMPWEGGKKNWEKTLYHACTDSVDFQWEIITDFLPTAIAYGVSIQLPEGLLCIGGCDAERCFDDLFLIYKEDDVFKLSYDWPPLPVPLANATGALLNNKIYIAGGQEKMTEEDATNHFFVLDLDDKDKGWIALPSWEGKARGYAVSVALENGTCPGFYLFSGRDYHSSGYVEILTDGYRYDPDKNSWTRLEGSFPVMAGTAIVDLDHILFFGGVTKLIPGSYEHPGFENILRVYDCMSNSFVHKEILPFPVPVTTHIAILENKFYITSGEIKPGMRTPSVHEGQIISLKK